MTLVTQFFCGLSKHRSADGRSFVRVENAPLHWDYRAMNPGAPSTVSFERCEHCGKVTSGMSAEQIMSARVSPWA